MGSATNRSGIRKTPRLMKPGRFMLDETKDSYARIIRGVKRKIFRAKTCKSG